MTMYSCLSFNYRDSGSPDCLRIVEFVNEDKCDEFLNIAMGRNIYIFVYCVRHITNFDSANNRDADHYFTRGRRCPKVLKSSYRHSDSSARVDDISMLSANRIQLMHSTSSNP